HTHTHTRIYTHTHTHTHKQTHTHNHIHKLMDCQRGSVVLYNPFSQNITYKCIPTPHQVIAPPHPPTHTHTHTHAGTHARTHARTRTHTQHTRPGPWPTAAVCLEPRTDARQGDFWLLPPTVLLSHGQGEADIAGVGV